ncbi:MAG UNVERIFIED_CONTAM: alpha/beta hydrolase [Anaerolineae bacterium]
MRTTAPPHAQQLSLSGRNTGCKLTRWSLHYPYLLFYGTADALVPPQMSEKLFEQVASADRTCHAYEGAYHETINDLCKE